MSAWRQDAARAGDRRGRRRAARPSARPTDHASRMTARASPTRAPAPPDRRRRQLRPRRSPPRTPTSRRDFSHFATRTSSTAVGGHAAGPGETSTTPERPLASAGRSSSPTTIRPRPAASTTPGRQDGAEDVRRAAHDVLRADGGGDLRLVVDAVLEREDARSWPEQRLEAGRGRLGVVGLHAEHHEVDRADRRRVVRRRQGGESIVPSGATMVRPSRRSASRCAPRAIRVTVAPPTASRAPK